MEKIIFIELVARSSFDFGCWMLDVGCWMLDVGCIPKLKQSKIQ
ncbi:MAG: hypothetical protein ACJASQ_001629 [Crocinitomicaceae bacterium]|jgi:hypothetical protein